jgi:hypothetical protein
LNQEQDIDKELVQLVNHVHPQDIQRQIQVLHNVQIPLEYIKLVTVFLVEKNVGCVQNNMVRQMVVLLDSIIVYKKPELTKHLVHLVDAHLGEVGQDMIILLVAKHHLRNVTQEKNINKKEDKILFFSLYLKQILNK